jgi:hypothetical protein
MTFQDLLAQIQTLKVEESRGQTGEYFEAVISRADLDPLHKILTAYFGAPLKPEGHSPSSEAKEHAGPYGGIRKDQTMYFRLDGEYSEYALLWPWGSGNRVTIKIIRSKGTSSSEGGWTDLLKNIFIRKPS